MKSKYTADHIENRTSDYVCWDCGIPFLTDEQQKADSRAITAHIAKCGLCGESKYVRHMRYWNNLGMPSEE